MENIIPVLIVVGALIYKVYQNYQEEMEKARKRQEQQKQQRPSTSVPLPEPIPQPEPVPAPPTHNQRLGRPKPQKIVITPKEQRKKELQEQAEARQEIPAEASRIRQQHFQTQPTQPIELEEIEDTDDATENTGKAAFDLKQAVIQSIILERPYK